MLPSILHIAEIYSLESDTKTYGKKESLFKCPFCEQDQLPANKNKYYLSLNTNDNVFKCWYCKKSGGVLQFETLLSNKPYEEIRGKYFGARKKHIHPAYNLSPEQLKQIGWQDKKRENLQFFQKQKNKVAKDWRLYEYEELVKHYALLTLISQFPIKNQKNQHYKWFTQVCEQSKVNQLNAKVIRQWNDSKEEKWAIEGIKIAKIARDISYESGDFEFQNLFVTVLFVHGLRKLQKQKHQNRNAPVSI